MSILTISNDESKVHFSEYISTQNEDKSDSQPAEPVEPAKPATPEAK